MLFNNFMIYIYIIIYYFYTLTVLFFLQKKLLKTYYIFVVVVFILLCTVSYHHAIAMDRLSGIPQCDQPETAPSSSESEEEQGATGIDISLCSTPEPMEFATEFMGRNHREESSRRCENRRYRKKKKREEKIQEEKKRYAMIEKQYKEVAHCQNVKQKIESFIAYPSIVAEQKCWMDTYKEEALDRLSKVSQERYEKERSIEEKQQQILRRQETKQRLILEQQREYFLTIFEQNESSTLRPVLRTPFQQQRMREAFNAYLNRMGELLDGSDVFLQEVIDEEEEAECLEREERVALDALEQLQVELECNLVQQYQEMQRRIPYNILSYREHLILREVTWSYSEALSKAVIAYDTYCRTLSDQQIKPPFLSYIEEAMKQRRSITEILESLDMDLSSLDDSREDRESSEQGEIHDVSWFGGNALLDEILGEVEEIEHSESSKSDVSQKSTECTEGESEEASFTQQLDQAISLEQRYLLQGARPRHPSKGGSSGSSLSLIPGFSFGGQLSSLQSMQYILCNVSEKVSTELKSLVQHARQQQYDKDNECCLTKLISRKRYSSISQYDTVQHTYNISSPYRVFGGVDAYSKNLEHKIRSSQAGVMFTPHPGYTVKLSYDHHKKDVQEHSGLQFGTAIGSVKSYIETDGLSTIFSWYPCGTGFTGHLAGYYGWGQLKNTRFFTHADNQVCSKGSTDMHLNGGMIQLGYIFLLSKKLTIIPYVESILSRVDWHSYKETIGVLPCTISSHKEICLEKSIGLCCQWHISSSTQLQCWGIRTSGTSNADKITSQPTRGPSTYAIIVPDYKKKYMRTELGLSYSSKLTDFFTIVLNSNTQLNSNKHHKQNVTVHLRYTY